MFIMSIEQKKAILLYPVLYNANLIEHKHTTWWLFYRQACFYLQYPSIWGTKVAQSVIPNSGDQESGEKDISHLPVEEVQSVVRLWHQSGFVSACVITFRALHKKHIQSKSGMGDDL